MKSRIYGSGSVSCIRKLFVKKFIQKISSPLSVLVSENTTVLSFVVFIFTGSYTLQYLVIQSRLPLSLEIYLCLMYGLNIQYSWHSAAPELLLFLVRLAAFSNLTPSPFLRIDSFFLFRKHFSSSFCLMYHVSILFLICIRSFCFWLNFYTIQLVPMYFFCR